MAIKVDLRKAFDSVQWDFLLLLLRALRFPDIFISWIRVCICDPKYSIHINGDNVGYFAGTRGLRQGDPLSPYLFILILQNLSDRLHVAFTNLGVAPHQFCKDPLVTHLAFADDLFLFAKATEHSAHSIKGVIDYSATIRDFFPT